MCEPISMGVAALAGGALLSNALQPKIPAASPTPPAAPPKQGEQSPDVDQLRRNNSGTGLNAGPGAGSSSTLLTGPGGVDLNDLSLNKNTLLGG